MMKKHFLYVSVLFFFACTDKQPENKTPHTDQNVSITVKKETLNPYVDVDVSPMDMSYYPVDYPTKKMHHLTTADPMARVIYSRPLKQGRKIFGGLVPYNKQWRLGANEATEIEFFQPVKIEDKKVNKGRYILYCIPAQDKWTMVLNNDIFTFGKQIDSTKDLMHFNIPVEKAATSTENFTMFFKDDKPGNAVLFMAWDSLVAKLPINFVTLVDTK